jgi:hypothetical protein
MDTVTYPDPGVDAELAAHFEGISISLLDKHPDFKEAAGGTAIPWAPTFRFTDAKGREVHRLIGWLDPRNFIAELRFVRGLAHLGRWRFDEALTLFEGVAEDHRPAQAAPAAGYYAGVVRFLRGKRDMAALKERWNRLRAEHPDSDWAKRAEVIDDLE